MRLKHIVSLLLALLLMAALALPACAEPVLNEVVTTGVEESSVGRILSEDEIKQMISVAVADLQPETTEPQTTEYTGLNIRMVETNKELFSQRNLTYMALGLSGFAVLLSIIALARSKKKTARNATGNYQKYF